MNDGSGKRSLAKRWEGAYTHTQMKAANFHSDAGWTVDCKTHAQLSSSIDVFFEVTQLSVGQTEKHTCYPEVCFFAWKKE